MAKPNTDIPKDKRKVVCIYLPYIPSSDVGALFDTKWKISMWKLFNHVLDDMVESVREPFSLEMYAVENNVYVTMVGGETALKYLSAGIYSYYGDCEIREVEDYAYQLDEDSVFSTADMVLSRSDIYPLQDAQAFAYDSLQPIVTSLSSLPHHDRMLVQMICLPIKDSILNQLDLWSERHTARLLRAFRFRSYFRQDLDPIKVHQKASAKAEAKGAAAPPGPTELELKGPRVKTEDKIKEKALMPMFWCNYRFTAISQVAPGEERKDVQKRLAGHVREVANTMKVYNTLDENSWKLVPRPASKDSLRRVQERVLSNPFRLSAKEVTTFWHTPKQGVIPNSATVVSRKGPPPSNLPIAQGDSQISFFAQTTFRDQFVPFGIRRFDRRRHFYIVGKSGSGKSCLLQLLIKNDIEHGFGAALLDPHGDLVDSVLRMIPEHRVKDVVVFDPSDVAYPPAFNPLAVVRKDIQIQSTLGFIDVFRRVFGSDWNESMDQVLRYSTLTMMSTPGASIVALRRLLSDPSYRASVVSQVADPSVRRFWESEFVSRQGDFEGRAVAPLLNRLDQLLATDMIRNVLSQSTSLLNFREFMDNRKIVLMKVSKGVLGIENATLLGSLLITKIFEAALSRADIPEESRQDFYFYVDEFQNFANRSFADILSEARKYRLCLTMANQFLDQLSGEVRQNIFGNIGNFLSFRVGANDADVVGQELQPRFGASDVLNLAFREFYLKMTVDGELGETFSARSLDVPQLGIGSGFVDAVISQSRAKYSVPVSQAIGLRSHE